MKSLSTVAKPCSFDLDPAEWEGKEGRTWPESRGFPVRVIDSYLQSSETHWLTCLMRKQVGEVFDRNTLFLLNNDGKPQKRRILDSLLQPPTTVVPLCSSWKIHKRKLQTLFYNWKTKLCFHIYNNIDWASTKCSLDTANNIFLQQFNCWHSHIFAFSCMSLYTQSISGWWLISFEETFKAYSCLIGLSGPHHFANNPNLCWSSCIIPFYICSNILPYSSY